VPEGATVSITIMGQVVVRVGFTPEGQGQFTLVSQLVADYFGVDMADVLVVPLDTHSAPPHFGP
ncbi:MAG: molybdopterin-dependent oxidoreductase, partial [Gemmatimonadetes bacterium]|nr:molybdopterin-dependent oxidoreductase [Gemmatimonadota bacterium]